MDLKLIEKFKEKLLAERKKVEKELAEILPKTNHSYGLPDIGKGYAGSSEELEDAAEEYENRLSVATRLKSRLQEIDAAILRIKKGAYGKCSNCKDQDVPIEQLEVNPAASYCAKCKT